MTQQCLEISDGVLYVLLLFLLFFLPSTHSWHLSSIQTTCVCDGNTDTVLGKAGVFESTRLVRRVAADYFYDWNVWRWIQQSWARTWALCSRQDLLGPQRRGCVVTPPQFYYSRNYEQDHSSHSSRWLGPLVYPQNDSLPCLHYIWVRCVFTISIAWSGDISCLTASHFTDWWTIMRYQVWLYEPHPNMMLSCISIVRTATVGPVLILYLFIYLCCWFKAIKKNWIIFPGRTLLRRLYFLC